LNSNWSIIWNSLSIQFCYIIVAAVAAVAAAAAP